MNELAISPAASADSCCAKKLQIMVRSRRPDFLFRRTDHYYDLYEGTAAGLVRERAVEAHQLPGQPGRAKTTASYLADGTVKTRGASHTEPGCKKIERIGVDRFRVLVAVSAEEQQRRHASARAQHEDEAALARARAELAYMTATPQQYRERCLAAVDAFMHAFRQELSATHHGAFCIDVQSMAAFDAAAAALRARVQSMGIAASSAARAQRVSQVCGRRGVSAEELGERQAAPQHLVLVSSR